MEVKEKALALHAQGCNCAQSVLCALSDYDGMDDATAKAVSAGFGGGMRTGEVCGAVAGAIMALGLASAKDGDGSVKSKAGELTKELIKQFKNEYGFARCQELIAAAGGHRRCDEFIAYCAQLAAAILDRNNAEIH